MSVIGVALQQHDVNLPGCIHFSRQKQDLAGWHDLLNVCDQLFSDNDLLGAVDTSLLASFERDTLPRLAQPLNRPPRNAPWRAGPRTESSDHGYSTMTDRNADDSERGWW